MTSPARTSNKDASTALVEFRKVRKERRYEQVAEQLRHLISKGVLKPGDHLPPERELAVKFGVGRSSLRDAIRTLEVMGIVEPRQGKGTVVNDLSADALVVPLASMLHRKRDLVSELLDVRRMIEPALAARAPFKYRAVSSDQWPATAASFAPSSGATERRPSRQ